MRISIFKNIKAVAPIKDVSVLKVLESIRDGKYKDQIAKIRIESDKEIRNPLKAKLNYVTFCGTFTSRANANLKQHSGLACIDLDDVVNLEDLRELINKDPYTLSCFLSPSGNGFKVLVKIPNVDNNEDYQDYYIELAKHYDKYHKSDESTKDIARACYLSYDDNLFLNNESEVFTNKFNRPLPVEHKVINIPLTDQNEIADRLDKWFQKRWSNVNRNNNLHSYARQMNAFGVSQRVCEDYLFRYGDPSKQREIENLIKSAYRYSNEHNTRAFEDAKRVKEVKNLVLAGEDLDKVKLKIPAADLVGLENEFKIHKEKLKLDEYWYYTDKDVIKLASYRFMQYLENNNIFKFYPNENNGAILFVKYDSNFIYLFEETKIKDFVLTQLRENGKIDAFELMANNTSNFNPNFLSMVRTIDVKFNKDTAEASYIYYNNCAAKTTKDKIEVLNYEDIDDLIWKNQVINRDLNITDKSDGVFKTFIWKLSGEDKDRYYTLKSVIGYLMHSHQNEAKPKAIIFNDEMVSDDIPNGGSGKGLIHRAIGQIKNVVVEDGKKFDPRGQFAYQNVSKDTQIFLMDDVPKNFNFENLFSIVTEGMTVEKKGQDAYKIPFSESPKISITTNYTVKGSGASHHRRIFEVEIANYFNENHTPEDEFKHQFFSQWNKEEWAKFDNFMIRCVQYFLKNGLVDSNKVNLDFRKLKNELGTEFIEFMESKDFNGAPLNRKEFRDEFNRSYPTIAKYNTAQKFNKKVKDYCSYNNINLEENKYNGVVCFYIGGVKKSELDVF